MDLAARHLVMCSKYYTAAGLFRQMRPARPP